MRISEYAWEKALEQLKMERPEIPTKPIMQVRFPWSRIGGLVESTSDVTYLSPRLLSLEPSGVSPAEEFLRFNHPPEYAPLFLVGKRWSKRYQQPMRSLFGDENLFIGLFVLEGRSHSRSKDNPYDHARFVEWVRFTEENWLTARALVSAKTLKAREENAP